MNPRALTILIIDITPNSDFDDDSDIDIVYGSETITLHYDRRILTILPR